MRGLLTLLKLIMVNFYMVDYSDPESPIIYKTTEGKSLKECKKEILQLVSKKIAHWKIVKRATKRFNKKMATILYG